MLEEKILVQVRAEAEVIAHSTVDTLISRPDWGTITLQPPDLI